MDCGDVPQKEHAPMIKIFKSDLTSLISECRPPFYLSNFRTHVGGDIPTLVYTVTVAGFNPQGRVCELVLSTGQAWAYDDAENLKARKWADDAEKEVRARLAGLELEIRDGRISESPVQGGLG